MAETIHSQMPVIQEYQTKSQGNNDTLSNFESDHITPADVSENPTVPTVVLPKDTTDEAQTNNLPKDTDENQTYNLPKDTEDEQYECE